MPEWQQALIAITGMAAFVAILLWWEVDID